MPPRVLRAQERPLPTLNAVLMPATTALLPRLSLQRRTRSRNRFSSFVLRLSACLHARPLVPFYAPLCLSRASRRSVPLLFLQRFISLSRIGFGVVPHGSVPSWIGFIGSIGFIPFLLILLGSIIGGRSSMRISKRVERVWSQNVKFLTSRII